jgi:hypothetical protein
MCRAKRLEKKSSRMTSRCLMQGAAFFVFRCINPLVRLNDMKTHMENETLAVRIDSANPDHHLWNNNGSWWCHYTAHYADNTAERIRVSLRTGNVEEARERRDQLFTELGEPFSPVRSIHACAASRRRCVR